MRGRSSRSPKRERRGRQRGASRGGRQGPRGPWPRGPRQMLTEAAQTHSLHQSIEGRKEPLSPGAGCPNEIWIERRQQLERVLTFAVTSLRFGVARGLLQLAIEVELPHFLKPGGRGRQGFLVETLTVEFCQSRPISHEPRFHALDHQMEVVLGCARRPLPRFAFLLGHVIPWRCTGHRAFCVDEQERGLVPPAIFQRRAELLERVPPSAASDEARHPALETSAFQQPAKRTAALGLERVAVSATLDKDLHHLVPPR